MKKFKLLFLLPLASAALMGCTLPWEKKDDPGKQETDKKDFKGLSLTDGSVVYDGEMHTLELQGTLPKGAKQEYVEGYEGGILPGEYEIKILVTCEGYNNKTYSATLTIVKADITGLTFQGASFHYDGQEHMIEVQGELPQDAELHYTIRVDEEDVEFAGASAVGSYNIKATVTRPYHNDFVMNATMQILANDVAENDLKVEDFEALTNNDLASDWKLEFYNNGWVTPQAATLSLEKNQIIPGGQKTMKMSLTQQGSAFKATRELGDLKTFAKYEGFSIDTYVKPFVDGSTCKLQVQFWFNDLPLPEAYSGYKNTYATFTLANDAPKGWAHWEVPFTDSSLSIASGAIPVSALSQLGYTFADFTMYLDKVAIIATPNYIDGKNINVNVDNIILHHEAQAETSHELFVPAGRYANAQGEHYLAMDINSDMATGAFLVDGAKVSDLEIEKTADGLVCKDAGYHGAGLTVNATIVDSKLVVGEVTGQMAAEYAGLSGLTFEKHANINIDFTDQAAYVGGKLHDDNWYQEKWDNTWQKVTDQMNIRGTAGDPHVNMVTGYTMDYRYTYTNAEKFGLANSFSMDIGNDYTGGTHDIKLKVKLIKASGVEVFAVGSSSEYYVVPANTAKWQNLKFKLDDPIEVSAIQVVVKSTGGYNQYLYVDNIKLSYAMPEPVAPVHEITDGEFAIWNAANDAYKLTISDTLTNASFTKYGTSDSYPMAVTVDGEAITIADKASSGAGLTMVGTIGENETIAIASATGTVGSALSASLVGKTFKKVNNNIALDFSDGVKDANYTEAHWKEQYYGNSGWTDYVTPTQMRSKVDKNSNKIVNFAVNTMTYNFKYTPDHPIGPVNHFEIDLGNYFGDTSGDILYKIALLNSSGGVARYMAGADGNDGFATLAKDTSQGNLCVKQTKDFDLTYAYAVRITVKLASGSGYLYMDNLKVNYVAPEPVVPAKTIEDGSYYIWNGNTDAFRMEVSGSQTAAVVTKLGGDSYPMTVEVNGETVTFKDAGYAGAGLTITATISATNEMTITNVTGQMASMMSGSLMNKVIRHCANMDLDFEDGAGTGAYQGAGWSEQKYTTTWVNVDTVEMNSRKDDNNSKIVNLVASNVTRNFIYDVDLPLGPVNHIDIDLGNFHSASATDVISYKIMIIDKGGTKYYAAGADGNNGFVTMTRDTANGNYLKHFSLDFNLCVGDKLQITTKTSANNASYFYVDNVHISYRAASETVAYKLVDTTGWDITAASPEFYAWVWGGNDSGHWEALTLKTDDGNYFDLSLFKGYTGMKIVRVNPESTKKPIVGSTKYGTYTSEQVWNETANIDLNGAGGNVNFSF